MPSALRISAESADMLKQSCQANVSNLALNSSTTQSFYVLHAVLCGLHKKNLECTLWAAQNSARGGIGAARRVKLYAAALVAEMFALLASIMFSQALICAAHSSRMQHELCGFCRQPIAFGPPLP